MATDVLITPSSGIIEFNNGVQGSLLGTIATMRVYDSLTTGNLSIQNTTTGVNTSGVRFLNRGVTGNIFEVYGTYGNLLTIDDDLTDSIFSINSSAGLPVFDVYSNNSVYAGQYGQYDFVITGNCVGIGLSTPTAKLHVQGTNVTTNAQFCNSSLGSIFQRNNTATSGARNGITLRSTNLGTASSIDLGIGIGFELGYGGTVGSTLGTRVPAGYITLNQQTNADWSVAANRFSYMQFATLNAGTQTEAMRILANGNVGINQTSPTCKLDVNSGGNEDSARFYNTAATCNLFVGSSNNTNVTDIVLYTSSGNAQIFKNRSSTGWGGVDTLNIYTSNGAIAFHPTGTTNAVYFNGSGSVGIGTTGPNSKLTVAGNADIGQNAFASQNGCLQIGNVSNNYLFTDGAWTSDIRVGLLCHCADNWEMAIHDSGSRVVSPLAFYGGGSSNFFAIGRDIGWGTTPVNFYDNIKVYKAIGAADDVRDGMGQYDTTNMAANIGGQLVLGYRYTTSGNFTEGAIIRMYKLNATDGDYSSGLKFQVRNSGAALSTKMTLNPSGNLGLGTTTPAKKLDVAGNINSDNSRTATYTSVSSGPSGSWYPLFPVTDSTDGSVICNIRTTSHSSASFIAAKGYGPSQTHAITVLDCQVNANTGYANITGIRMRESGWVEIQLSWSSGPIVDVGVQIIGSNYTPGLAGSLAPTAAGDAVVDTVTLANGMLRSRGNMEAASGYIGANTTSPARPLTVNGDGTNPCIRLLNSSFATSTNTALYTFRGWLPIDIGTTKYYLQVFN